MDIFIYIFVVLFPVVLVAYVLWGIRLKYIKRDYDEADARRGES